jgi:hypothetical protein
MENITIMDINKNGGFRGQIEVSDLQGLYWEGSNANGHLEKPPQSDRFVIHWFGDLREAANAGTGRVLGR